MEANDPGDGKGENLPAHRARAFLKNVAGGSLNLLSKSAPNRVPARLHPVPRLMEVLTPDSCPLWREVLAQCPAHDFHHLPEYHAHAEAHGEGRAHLFVHREPDATIAVPLLLRPLDTVPGLGETARGLFDATSVYGYAGPIASRDDVPDSAVRAFTQALAHTLREMRVVTVFSRLHPLLEQRHLLTGLGECVLTGRTLSLDLTPPVEEQFRKFRKGHRRGLKKLRELGLTVIEDTTLGHLDEFVEIYSASMRRVGAAPQYFFDRAYFASLVERLGPAMRLFVVKHGAQVVAATLHSAYNGIVHAHLGGTRDHALEWSPDKLLIDEVRLWAVARGHRVFHHGGGVGAREDNLYRFKEGFSDCVHEFFTWRWVLDPGANRALCDARGVAHAGDYFPAYRAPAAPAAPAAAARNLGGGFAGLLLGSLLSEGATVSSPASHASRSPSVEVCEAVCSRWLPCG